MEINKGNLILGEFEVTALVSADLVYQWARARNLGDGRLVLLQILRAAPLSSKENLVAFMDCFDALGGLSRRSLHLPAQVLSDSRYPVVAVYSILEGEALEDFLKVSPDQAADHWHQASEAINVLHNRGLVHGGLTPRSFISAAGNISLTGFGYAPLGRVAPRLAKEVFGSFLAPETEAGQPLTKFSDIYAFAQTVAHWRPDLKSSSWYRQATHQEPTQRFRNMRDLTASLESVLTSSEVRHSPAKEGVPVVPSGPRIVPKFTLSVVAEPPEGGEVRGEGRYPAGDAAAVSASPAPGWQFDTWTADLQETRNPATVMLDANKAVVARFSRLRQAEWRLITRAEPAHGGDVTGGGDYPERTRVDVEARPAKGWEFEAWRGDLRGRIRRASVVMSDNKTAVAVFRKLSEATVSVRAEPSEGGRVVGGGTYAFGENVSLRAIPNPSWRFSHWSGDPLEDWRNPIELSANGDRSLVAHFARTIWEEVDLVLTIAPPQGGIIEGVGHGRSKHQKGRLIRVTARANDGWRFVAWEGDTQGFVFDSGSTTDLMIPMDGHRTVTALFAPLGTKRENAPTIGRAFQVGSVATSPSARSDPPEQSPPKADVPKWTQAPGGASADDPGPSVKPGPDPASATEPKIKSKPAFGKAFLPKTDDA